MQPSKRLIGLSHLRTRVLALENEDATLEDLGIAAAAQRFYWRDAVVRLSDYDCWERVDDCPTDEIDWGKTVIRYQSGLQVVISEPFEEFTKFMIELLEGGG